VQNGNPLVLSLAPSLALALRATFGRAKRQSCRFVELPSGVITTFGDE
jgi:hypothetical protein